MTIALVNFSSTYNSAHVNSPTIALPTYAAGDYLLAVTAVDNTGAVIAVPSGWTTLAGGDSSSYFVVYGKMADGSEGTSIPQGTSGVACDSTVASFSGVSSTAPSVGTAVTGNNNVGDASIGGTYPTGLAVACWFFGANTTWSVGGSWTLISNDSKNPATGMLSLPLTSGGGQQDCVVTWGTSKAFDGVVVALPAAGSGSTNASVTGVTASFSVSAPAGSVSIVEPNVTVSGVTASFVLAATAGSVTAGGQTPTVTWNGSALAGTAGTMVACYDGTWHTGIDIGGVTRMQPDGSLPQFQKGDSVDTSGLNQALGKCASYNSDGTHAWLLTGTAGSTGNGGVFYRDLTQTTGWVLQTESYNGDVSGPIASGRVTGHRLIALDTRNHNVYIGALGASGLTGSIITAPYDGTGSFTSPVSGNQYVALNMSSSVTAEPVLYYAYNGSDTSTKVVWGTPSDIGFYCPTAATKNGVLGLGLSDIRDFIVITENGVDVLYVMVGNTSTDGGIYRVVITNDPSQAVPTYTMTEISVGNIAGSSAWAWKKITGRRNATDTATYLMAFCSPTEGTVPTGTGTIPVSAGTFAQAAWRTLDATDATPVWECVSNGSNMLDVNNNPNPIYGTSSEVWVLQTGAVINSSNNCVLGGNQWNPYDADIDTSTDTIVVAGKSAAWITLNPWASDYTTVSWAPAVKGTGGVINYEVRVHPTDSTAWTQTDVDRGAYYSLDAGSTMQSVEDALSDICHANWICDSGFSVPGRWLLGTAPTSGSTPMYYSDDWYGHSRDTAPTFSTGTVSASALDLCAIAAITYAGVDYYIAVDALGGGLYTTTNPSGTWTLAYTLPTPNDAMTQIIAQSGYKDFWVMNGGSGLLYFPDITNIATPTTVWLPKGINNSNAVPASDKYNAGRVTQDSVTRTTLYVSWGSNLPGVFKLTNCDTTTFTSSTTSGGITTITPSGTGTAIQLFGGDLTQTTPVGPISMRSDGSMVALVAGWNGTPDALWYDGTTWTSIAGNLYPDIGVLPVSVLLTDTRIYSSMLNAGTPYAELSSATNVSVTGVTAGFSLSAPAGNVSATANVAITGSVAAFSLAASAGTISTTTSVSVAGTAAPMALSAPAGSVSTTTSVTVSGVVAGLTLSAPAGSVATTDSVAITGVVASLSLSAPAGSVSTGTSVAVTGVVASLALSAPAGSVATGTAVTIAGGVSSLALSAPAGSVSTTSSVAVSGVIADLAISAPTGSVSTTTSVTVAGLVADLAIAAPSGSVSATTSVSVQGVVAPFALSAPTGGVSAGGSISLAGATASFAVAAPAGSVTTTRSVVVAGAVATFSVGAEAGTVTAGYSYTATGAAAALHLSAPAGSVSTSCSISGPVAKLSLLALAGNVTVGGSVEVQAPVAQFSLVAQAGTVSTTVSTTVEGIPAVMTFDALPGAIYTTQSCDVGGVVAELNLSAVAGFVLTKSLVIPIDVSVIVSRIDPSLSLTPTPVSTMEIMRPITDAIITS